MKDLYAKKLNLIILIFKNKYHKNSNKDQTFIKNNKNKNKIF